MRIFILSRAPEATLNDVLLALQSLGQPLHPIWVLRGGGQPGVDASLEHLAALAQPVALIASENLLESIARWQPIAKVPSGESTTDWFAVLGLPRH